MVAIPLSPSATDAGSSTLIDAVSSFVKLLVPTAFVMVALVLGFPKVTVIASLASTSVSPVVVTGIFCIKVGVPASKVSVPVVPFSLPPLMT